MVVKLPTSLDPRYGKTAPHREVFCQTIQPWLLMFPCSIMGTKHRSVSINFSLSLSLSMIFHPDVEDHSERTLANRIFQKEM